MIRSRSPNPTFRRCRCAAAVLTSRAWIPSDGEPVTRTTSRERSGETHAAQADPYTGDRNQARREDAPERISSALALGAGPVLVTAGFALHPGGSENGTQFVRTVARHPHVWVASHLLIFAGLLTLVAGLPVVLELTASGGRRMVQAGIAVASLGGVAMALDAATHGYLAYIVAARSDVGDSLAAAIETAAENSSWASTTSLVGALFPLGVLLLAVGSARAGVTKVVAGLLVVGIAGVGVAGAGLLTLLTTAPLVLGFAGLARAGVAAPNRRSDAIPAGRAAAAHVASAS